MSAAQRWFRAAWARKWLILAYGFPLALGAAIRTRLAFLSAEQVTSRLFIDDSFFYYRVAQHVALGHGSTFDGTHLTNGYHPLWTGILAVMYRLFPDFQGSYLASTLFLQAAFCLVGAFFLWKTVRLMTPKPWIAWAAFTLYWLNPRVIFYTMNGMETSVYMMLFAVYLFLFFRWALRSRDGYRQYAVMGVVAGFLLLARSESLIILAVTFGVLLAKSKINRWKTLAWFAIPAFFIVLPIIALNYKTFHTFSQINAYAPVMGKRLLFVGPPLPSFTVASAAFQLKQGLWELENDVKEYSAIVAMRVPLLILLGVALLLFGMSARGEPDSGTFRRHLKWFLVPIGAFAIIFFLNSVGRWYNRTYYNAPWNLFAVLFAAIVLDGLARLKLKNAAAISATFLVLAAGSYALTWRRDYRVSVQIPQSTNYAAMIATRWANEHLPDGARIGSFKHAGVVSFWSRFHVENLDGKINNTVFPYLMRREAANYLRENNIGYIIEPDGKLETRQGFFGDWKVMDHAELLYRTDETSPGAPTVHIDVFKIRFD